MAFLSVLRFTFGKYNVKDAEVPWGLHRLELYSLQANIIKVTLVNPNGSIDVTPYIFRSID